MTDRDLVVRALAVGRPPDSPVTAVMTREVVVLEECTDLLAAAVPPRQRECIQAFLGAAADAASVAADTLDR